MTREKETATPNPLATAADDETPRVLLMRHAQTHANAQGFFLGRRDEGVTGLGEEQSRRAVAGLVAWRPDRIICSPLKRCKTMIAEPAARELGIEEAYLSVHKTNPASLAVQQHCGARIDHEDKTEYYTRIATCMESDGLYARGD